MPLKPIFTEIEAALHAGLYFSALTTTLTLPDICAALGDAKGVTSGAKFAAWFDTNLPAYAGALPGAQCWKMRCGLLHQARAGRADMTWHQVAFGLGGPEQTLMRGGTFNGLPVPDTYILNAPVFCRAVVKAARDWLAREADNEAVIANLPYVVRFRPEGLPPQMVGMPVIA